MSVLKSTYMCSDDSLCCCALKYVCLSSAALTVTALEAYRKIPSTQAKRMTNMTKLTSQKQAREIEIQITEMAFKLSIAQGPSNFK